MGNQSCPPNESSYCESRIVISCWISLKDWGKGTPFSPCRTNEFTYYLSSWVTLENGWTNEKILTEHLKNSCSIHLTGKSVGNINLITHRIGDRTCKKNHGIKSDFRGWHASWWPQNPPLPDLIEFYYLLMSDRLSISPSKCRLRISRGLNAWQFHFCN